MKREIVPLSLGSHSWSRLLYCNFRVCLAYSFTVQYVYSVLFRYNLIKVFYHSDIREGSAAVSVFSLRWAADHTSVWYAEVLLPLTLCPYVLYNAIGGAILSSAVMGRDKAGLLLQMTHDRALRPGLLFMAYRVSKGSLPWGAEWLLPTKLASSTYFRPRGVKKENCPL